ncbi:hypothetical protein BaRGS_00022926, partial [Batillaria attramentaria]
MIDFLRLREASRTISNILRIQNCSLFQNRNQPRKGLAVPTKLVHDTTNDVQAYLSCTRYVLPKATSPFR